jgi:predicted metal-dependent HD superfamily phosphohydrolase
VDFSGRAIAGVLAGRITCDMTTHGQGSRRLVPDRARRIMAFRRPDFVPAVLSGRRTMTQPQASATRYQGDPAELPADPDLTAGMPYRHYKGGAYTVVGLGRLEADLSPAVVYRSMREPSLLWVRSAEVFSETVQTPEGAVPRFSPDWPRELECLDFLPRQSVLQVLALYDAAYRHYHDRHHVLEMFRLAHERSIALSPAQALAVLFHDAVYVPGCEFNEAASAALIETMACGVDGETTRLAAQIVLDTRTHEAGVADAAVVLDLDLHRLAAPADAFDAFSLAVFEENRPLLAARTGLAGEALWQAFMQRRAAFLTTLAQRPRLFLTEAFADCEAPARRNIERVAGTSHA